MPHLYKFTKNDLLDILQFVRDYHLDPSKTSQGRTNQGKRGFGGEIDAFLKGKLCEVAACKIIEKFSNNKKLLIDLEIYSNAEVGKRKDPDIKSVFDESLDIKRTPNAYVEVKKIDENEHWMGARQEQIEEDLKNNTNGYMVHVSMYFDDDKNHKERDITGSALKEILGFDNSLDLGDFSNFTDLTAKIEYIYSYKDLKEKGFFFQSGLIMPATDFGEMKQGVFLKDGSMSKQYEFVQRYTGKNEITMEQGHTIKGNYDMPAFTNWTVTGDFEIYRKIETRNKYIVPISNSVMENNVIGSYDLQPKKTYVFHLTNRLVSRDKNDAVKNVNEYSFSRKRLENIQAQEEDFSLESMMKKIAKEI